MQKKNKIRTEIRFHKESGEGKELSYLGNRTFLGGTENCISVTKQINTLGLCRWINAVAILLDGVGE